MHRRSNSTERKPAPSEGAPSTDVAKDEDAKPKEIKWKWVRYTTQGSYTTDVVRICCILAVSDTQTQTSSRPVNVGMAQCKEECFATRFGTLRIFKGSKNVNVGCCTQEDIPRCSTMQSFDEYLVLPVEVCTQQFCQRICSCTVEILGLGASPGMLFSRVLKRVLPTYCRHRMSS